MNKAVCIAGVALLLLLSAAALGQEKFDPAGAAKRVGPYLDASSFVIIRVDLTRVDFDAFEKWMTDMMLSVITDPEEAKEQRGSVHGGMGMLRQVVDGVRKAGGGEMFFVVPAGNLRDQEPFLIFPLRAGADAVAMRNAIVMGGNADRDNSFVERIGDSMVKCFRESDMRRLKSQTPIERPEVAAAFAAAGDATAQMVALSTPTARQFLAASVKEMPKELVAGSVDQITEKIYWIALGGDLTPKLRLRVAVQASGADAAAALKQLVGQIANAIRPGMPKVAAAIEGVKLEQERLALAIEGPEAQSAVTEFVRPQMLMARETALRVKSMSNIRSLLMLCVVYAEDHQGKWPDNLAELGNIASRWQRNPRQRDRKDGYVYVKPAGTPTANDVVVYEAFEKWEDGISVGYGDGHCEWVASKERFETELAATKRAK